MRGWQAKASSQSASPIVLQIRSAASLNAVTSATGRNATMASAQRRAPQQAIIAASALSALATFQDASVEFTYANPPNGAQLKILRADWRLRACGILRWSECHQWA